MNGIPKYMMMIFAANVQKDKDFEERFAANHMKTSKSVPLTIQDVSVSDSAVYYCALRPTVTQTHSTLIQWWHLLYNLVITLAMQKRATNSYYKLFLNSFGKNPLLNNEWTLAYNFNKTKIILIITIILDTIILIWNFHTVPLHIQNQYENLVPI